MTKQNTAAAQPATDLRQRAAHARDAAGRFIRRSASAAGADQDPALPVTALFNATWDALGKALDAEVPDDLVSELQAAESAAYDRLRAVRPTSPAGFRALAKTWADVLEGERGGELGVTLADHAADSLIAGADHCTPRVQTSGGAEDPVLALIEKHRVAFAEWDRLSDVWNEMQLSDPGYAEAMAASKEPGKREVAAYRALFTARPTTLAGAAAWAAYLDRAACRTRIDAEPSDGERALGVVAVALSGLAPAGSAAPHPDAALFALGDQFMAAWAAEEEAPDGGGYRACNRLAQQIVHTPAVTAAGYGIKALLLARLDEDDSSPRKPAKAQGPLASHWNVLRQVQRGAARLAAAPDIGIPMSAPAEAVTGIPVSGAKPSWASLVDMLDLDSATVDELQTIRDVADRVGGAAYALSWRRSCHRSTHPHGAVDFNDAGKLMQWVGDALTDVETAVDNEIARRSPTGRSDRETRLAMLAVRTIDNGDPEAIRAFAHELLDHAAAESRGA